MGTRQGISLGDTAAGILAAGLSEDAVGQTINLGNGKEITISRLATMIAEVLGRPDAEIAYAERRPGDALRLLSDSSKARNLFGFKPTVSLRDALMCLRDWSNIKSPEELLEEEVVLNWQLQSRITKLA